MTDEEMKELESVLQEIFSQYGMALKMLDDDKIEEMINDRTKEKARMKDIHAFDVINGGKE